MYLNFCIRVTVVYRENVVAFLAFDRQSFYITTNIKKVMSDIVDRGKL